MIPDINEQYAFRTEVSISNGEERMAKFYRNEDLNYMRKKLNASRNRSSRELGYMGNRCYEAARTLVESLETIYRLEDSQQFEFITTDTVLAIPNDTNFAEAVLTTSGYVLAHVEHMGIKAESIFPYDITIAFTQQGGPENDVYTLHFQFYDKQIADNDGTKVSTVNAKQTIKGAIPAPSAIGMSFMRAYQQAQANTPGHYFHTGD